MSKTKDTTQSIFSEARSIEEQIRELKKKKAIVVTEIKSAFTPEEIKENAERESGNLNQIVTDISDVELEIKVQRLKLKDLKRDKKIIEKRAKEMLSLASIKINASPRASKVQTFEVVDNMITCKQITLDFEVTLQIVDNKLWYEELKSAVASHDVGGAQAFNDSISRNFLYQSSLAVKKMFDGEKFPTS